MAKEYKEVNGRIYIREDGRYSGSRPLEGREGAVAVDSVQSPLLVPEPLNSGWGSSIEEAREIYLTLVAIPAPPVDGPALTPEDVFIMPPIPTVSRAKNIVDNVVSEGRPTLLPYSNRVFVGRKGNLSVYLRTDGRLALSKPVFEFGANGEEFPVMNAETGKQKYRLTELSDSEYDVFSEQAILAAKTAWDNSEAVYPAGTVVPRRVEIIESDNFYNNNDVVDNTLCTISADYGQHILDTDGTVRFYFATDENTDELVPNYEANGYNAHVRLEYSVIGNINDPKVRTLYEAPTSKKTVDEQIAKSWEDLARDPLNIKGPRDSYLDYARQSLSY
jgi:hypothetical protein